MISLAECLNTALPCSSGWQTRLAREWPSAVGQLATRMRLEQIKGELLIIGVYDSHWIAELFMLAPGIISEINNFLGETRVHQLRFVLTTNSNKTHTKKCPDGPTIRKRATMSARHEQILATIKDRQLHDALEKFFYTSVT